MCVCVCVCVCAPGWWALAAARYARMLAVGVPEDAVRVKMRGDGVDVPVGAMPEEAPLPAPALAGPGPVGPVTPPCLADLLRAGGPALSK